MHIVDGILSAPVLIGGGVATAVGVTLGLRALDEEKLPRAGVLSAAFFVASLVHVPIGPGSVHLMLNGLLGLMLGWAAFPAVLVAVFLQAVFFSFGGIWVLGVNTLNVALPAVLVGALLGAQARRPGNPGKIAAFAVGALSIMATSVMVAGSLAFSGEAFWLAAKLIILAHLPIALLEGVLTMTAFGLLQRAWPTSR